MTTLSPWEPIFRRKLKYGDQFTPGSIIGSMNGTASPGAIAVSVSLPQATAQGVSVTAFPSTQSTGAGTTTVTLGYPADIEDGDVVVVVCRKDDAWGTLPSGFTEKEDYVYSSPNDISVVTGTYDLATHGANFSVSYAGGAAGLTRAILWAVRGVGTATGGFATNTDTGNDKFYPTLTTPAGASVGFCFGFSNAEMTDEQANGWTDDWDDFATRAYHQIINSAGAQTMPRWDNIGNVSMVSFYLAAA